MNNSRQTTLDEPVSYSGIGIHSGEECHVKIEPAAANYGIRFVRTDLRGRPEIPVCPDVIAPAGAGRQTTLVAPDQPEAVVQTVEHILAALSGLQIDNVRIEMDGQEAPIDDGSAANITERLLQAGTRDLDHSARCVFRVPGSLSFRPNARSTVAYTIWPSQGLTISYFLEYDHPLIGRQAVSFDITPDVFSKQIAPARTFCLQEEVEYLRSKGLIRGGSLDNAIVVGRERIIGNELFWPDEMARHKLLDLMGDLAMLGVPIRGHIISHMGGHATNAEFVEYLRKEMSENA